MAAIDVIIGERPGDHIRIRVTGRTDLAARDYWDSNWLVSSVTVQAGGWKGRNEKAFFRTEELSSLRAKVELLHEGRLRDAEFAPMEPHVRFRLGCEAEGAPVSVSGAAVDQPEGGNRLEFRMTMPFDALPSLAARLRAVEAAYPTIGKG